MLHIKLIPQGCIVLHTPLGRRITLVSYFLHRSLFAGSSHLALATRTALSLSQSEHAHSHISTFLFDSSSNDENCLLYSAPPFNHLKGHEIIYPLSFNMRYFNQYHVFFLLRAIMNSSTRAASISHKLFACLHPYFAQNVHPSG